MKFKKSKVKENNSKNNKISSNESQIDNILEKDLISDNFHEFKVRSSLLDVLTDSTNINKSGFRGFFNLAIVVMMFYVFTQPIHNYLNHGYLWKTKFFAKMLHNLHYVILIWPLFYFWSYLAYIHEILKIKNYNSIFAIFLNIQFKLLF